MTGRELKALQTLRFNWAEGPEDVWSPSDFHVEGLNRTVERAILGGLADVVGGGATSPIGLVLSGQRGSGKTHLLGWVRERIQQEGGYFFLVGLLDARTFWESTLVSMLDGLSRDGSEGESQLKILLRRLSELADVPRWVQREVIGNRPVTREGLDAFADGVRRFNPHAGKDAKDTLRALVLRAGADYAAQDVGDGFLSALPEEEPGERAAWGIRQFPKTPQEIIKDLSRLLALTGPSVIAVDQIDVLVAQSPVAGNGTAVHDWHDLIVVDQMAGGLMALRETTRRTLTILSCLQQTWTLVEKFATDTARDRFRIMPDLKPLPDAETARALVEKRFATRFAEHGFEPPYPTWPVRPAAFDGAGEYTPRQLLIRIDEHIEACLADQEARELESLDRAAGPQPPRVRETSDFTGIDARFAELRRQAQVADALDAAVEDAVMPALLAAGLSAWIDGLGEAGRRFSVDPPPSKKPPLHARLRRTLDEETEDEAHWAFRAIAATHPVAALSRLRAASVMAGLNAEVPKRRLFVLRTVPWSKGPRTLAAVAAFEQAGGRVLVVEEEDLRSLAALRQLYADNPPDLRAWLAARRPAHEVKLLREALADADVVHAGVPHVDVVHAEPVHVEPVVTEPVITEPVHAESMVTEPVHAESMVTEPVHAESMVTEPVHAESMVTEPVHAESMVTEPVHAESMVTEPVHAESMVTEPVHAEPAVAASVIAEPAVAQAGGTPYIPLGGTVPDGRPVGVELEALRKHAVIFAGSGSGKTVLIRRLVEECALQGVSAIVLDPNNDLARLGDGWPEPPPQWVPGDAEKAADYLAATDVVIWTPGRIAGRPLSFQPLPDFASVAADADEFAAAVDAAVASLVPRAKLDSRTARAQHGQAVLREALAHYGRGGGQGLPGLIELLAALPYGVSGLANAERIAADLAQTLKAAMVNDPLFAGTGAPVDPGVLLTPPPGRRARVSVISFVGLSSDEQRQGFVNQLQMALFAWIRKHPAGDRPLGGLFVMDEAQTFAPSGAMTACTQSTLTLAAQARKYGLGLVFATQAPKGLHNRIPGNATTQFFGLLNAPTQIEAAKEVARSKGGEVADISRLMTGQFYLAPEGAAFVKTRVPLCLTHHPKAPLTAEEVVTRASTRGEHR
ncbi:helicase HerA domain-containing protein [Streptosporangium sp. CA-135522]|uniref:ATP-binding protein n=1 Tax=Streptosporangium sp. CA-135522 TaxID=3240072 RepID=UPI003D8C7CEE